MQFKVDDNVKVMRRSIQGEVYWSFAMNKAIGKVYVILEVTQTGNLLLNTRADLGGFAYYFPVGSVEKVITKNQQLIFSFME